MILLNLTSTPIGIHKLSFFEIVTENPMHLAPVSFDPQQIKGEKLQYCKDLIASVKNNHTLVGQSFHSVPLRDKDLKHHTLQPGDFVYGKRHFQKNALLPHWRDLYQVLPTFVPSNSRNRLLDSCETPKRSMEP